MMQNPLQDNEEGSKRLECPDCEAGFENEDQLKQHFDEQHVNEVSVCTTETVCKTLLIFYQNPDKETNVIQVHSKCRTRQAHRLGSLLFNQCCGS